MNALICYMPLRLLVLASALLPFIFTHTTSAYSCQNALGKHVGENGVSTPQPSSVYTPIRYLAGVPPP